LLKNAISKGGADDVIAACELVLSQLPKSKTVGAKRASSEIT
jgi:hypothetical protein